MHLRGMYSWLKFSLLIFSRIMFKAECNLLRFHFHFTIDSFFWNTLTVEKMCAGLETKEIAVKYRNIQQGRLWCFWMPSEGPRPAAGTQQYRNGAWSLLENFLTCQCKVWGLFNHLIAFKERYFYVFSIGLWSLLFYFKNASVLFSKKKSTFLMNMRMFNFPSYILFLLVFKEMLLVAQTESTTRWIGDSVTSA